MTVINAKINATSVVVEAYLAITQDISQGVTGRQIVSIDCGGDGKSKACNECIKYTKNELKRPPKEVQALCASICTCNIDNIKLKNMISFNAKAFLKVNAKEQFKTQINNSITQKAKQSGGDLFTIPDKTTNLTKTIDNLYTKMSTGSIQTALQNVQNLQTVSLAGPGDIYNVDMTVAIDYISTILTSDNSIMSSLDELTQNILQLSTQVTNAGLAQLIMWIVKIVLIIVILIVLFYSINLIFQLYALYV